MTSSSKRILVLCCHGLYQDFLVKQLNKHFVVCGVVRHQYFDPDRSRYKRYKKYLNPYRLLKRVYVKYKLLLADKRAKTVIEQLFYSDGKPPAIDPSIDQIESFDVNENSVIDFIKHKKPDLICVNGTNLLRAPMLDLIDDIPFGIINLHTGLSPYSRGGNCNLNMLLEDHPELVGITIHHINKGIDSGDIIISAQTQLNAQDNYEMIDAKSFDLGIKAMVSAAMQLFNGNSERVIQWQQGKLFLNRTGYIYEPHQRVQVNRKIENGLIKSYLENQQNVNQNVKTIGKVVV